jgi:class 3 adenylate cyclase
MVRIGLHTGEIERKRDDDIAGIAVHIAARVAALAEPGQILVSSTVRDLVAGSGLRFDDCGLHEVKGLLPGHVHFYTALARCVIRRQVLCGHRRVCCYGRRKSGQCGSSLWKWG